MGHQPEKYSPPPLVHCRVLGKMRRRGAFKKRKQFKKKRSLKLGIDNDIWFFLVFSKKNKNTYGIQIPGVVIPVPGRTETKRQVFVAMTEVAKRAVKATVAMRRIRKIREGI